MNDEKIELTLPYTGIAVREVTLLEKRFRRRDSDERRFILHPSSLIPHPSSFPSDQESLNFSENV